MELAEPIILLASIFGVFLWLRNDITNFRDDMRKGIQQLRNDIQRLESKVDGLDSSLRAVETEQSRVTGLLEGLALSGTLPDRES
ncbi:MAG: hypothetical protein OXG78_08585 [Chloroflexi bacterium]|nr:hypothetical protein [Chloroflexota bacterium]